MVGRGSFTESFPLFGYSLSDYDELFAEKLDLLLALRDGQPVTWHGKFRPSLDNATVYPRQEGQPAPDLDRCWRHAEFGHPGRYPRPADGTRDHRWPAGGLHAAGRALPQGPRVRRHDPGTPLAVHSHGYVFTDERAARAEFLPAYRQTFAKIGRERGWPPMSDAAVEDLIGPEGALFFGDPRLWLPRSSGCTS